MEGKSTFFVEMEESKSIVSGDQNDYIYRINKEFICNYR